jgi:hypothetical protein
MKKKERGMIAHYARVLIPVHYLLAESSEAEATTKSLASAAAAAATAWVKCDSCQKWWANKYASVS